jgi:hypothetical protein
MESLEPPDIPSSHSQQSEDRNHSLTFQSYPVPLRGMDNSDGDSDVDDTFDTDNITPRQRNRRYSESEPDQRGVSDDPRVLPFNREHSAASMFSTSSALTNPSFSASATDNDFNNASNTGNSVSFGEPVEAASVRSYPTRYLSSPSAVKPRLGSQKRLASAMQLTFDGNVRQIALKSSGDFDASITIGDSIHSQISRSGSHGSGGSSGEDQEDETGDAYSEDNNGEIEQIVVWNVKLPMWLSHLILKPPSVTRISACIVGTAPCFWFCCNKVHVTDRTVLTRLNILLIFMFFFQFASAMWLTALLLIADDEKGALKGFTPNYWNINGAVFSIGILACIFIPSCFCTIRVVKAVDLMGAIRYLWVFLWLLPFEIFFTISLFDYHRVTGVWIRHWWLEPTMSWFRRRFCPDEYEDNLCIVPIMGGPDFDTEDEWCLFHYNSTECTDIRDDAQIEMETALLTCYSALAGWSCVVLMLLFLMIHSLEKVISKPIVQKSRESNVPAWLSVPTCGCALVGGIFQYSPSSLLSSSSGSDENPWIGVVYLVAAGLFLVAALMGWFLSAVSIRSSADKRQKSVAVIVFIAVMAANTVVLGALFIASIIFSVDLVDSPIEESSRGPVACFVDRDVSCTKCESYIPPSERCPEWPLDDVTRILGTQLKQSASLAAIFILYAIGVLRFGIGLRRHLGKYQIDYA